MIKKKLLKAALVLTLCTSLIMPVTGVNMRQVMAEEVQENRKPSIVDAPEEWNGVDDFVIHVDKGAGKYEVDSINGITFFWSSQGKITSPSYHGVPTVNAEDIKYDADKGEIRIDGKLLLDKIGKYVVTGNRIRYYINGIYSNLYDSFTYTGETCASHYPAVLGDENEGGAKSIEWNGLDDLVIPIDKGSGEYEMVSYHFYSEGKYGAYGRLLGSDSDYCIYDSSKGGAIVNAAALYSLYKRGYSNYEGCYGLRMDFTLANGEEFEGYELNITANAKPETDENGFVIIDGHLVDYFGETSEITIPETVTTIMPAALSNLKEAKVTINGNHTIIEDDAFGRHYNIYSSLQELILNGDIKYLGVYEGDSGSIIDTVTVNGMIGNMSSSIRCNNLIVNGDIAYISKGRDDYLKDTKIYCKESSNILRYAKENNLNYEIIEEQPNEPQIQLANNEFDGTKDLVFKLDNISDIKEIKDVYLLLSDNVYDNDANILTNVQYVNNGLTNEFEYNPETGEVTLYKELVSKTYGYDYVSIGNTFLGHIVYTAQDGTEKHVFGDWKVKILDKSPNATAQYMYRLPDGKTSISNSDMQDLIKQNETQDICITANGIAYTFAKGTMKVVEGRDSYDFGAEVIKEYSVLINPPFTENEFAFRINYNYEGDLPATANITIPAGNQWAGKTLYYYEVTESGFYKFITSSVVDEAGNFTITQSHCSDYVALTKSPDEMPEDTKSPDNTNTSTDSDKTGTTNNKETPQTGDKNIMWLYMVLAAGAFSAILITKRKRAVK